MSDANKISTSRNGRKFSRHLMLLLAQIMENSLSRCVRWGIRRISRAIERLSGNCVRQIAIYFITKSLSILLRKLNKFLIIINTLTYKVTWLQRTLKITSLSYSSKPLSFLCTYKRLPASSLPSWLFPRIINSPSSLLQVMFGVGDPVASQRSETLLPSLTTISVLVG